MIPSSDAPHSTACTQPRARPFLARHPYQSVVHVFGRHVSEVWDELHNVPVENIRHKEAAFFFALFARTVLLQAKEFICDGHPHVVMRTVAGGGQVTEELSGVELQSLYGGGGSRKASELHPRKRRRDEEGLA